MDHEWAGRLLLLSEALIARVDAAKNISTIE
jgi:hypothetical protein